MTIETQEVERCFAFALDPDNKISLYEVTRGDLFDNYGSEDQSKIPWSMETPAYSFGDITNGLHIYKELTGGSISVSGLQGDVDFAVKWRPNKLPNWTDWNAWQECATVECKSVFCDVPNALQYRDPILLPKPSQSTCDPSNKINQTSVGYMFQCKISVEGPGQIDDFRILASPKNTPVLAVPCDECSPRGLADCPDELFAYQIP